MQLQIHNPAGSPLENYVTAIWELTGIQNCRETIIPQGIVEIIFNFAERAETIFPGAGTVTRAPRCFIQGIHTRAIAVDYTGRHHLLGVRLHPHRIEEALGVLPSQLVNTAVDLTLIHPRFDSLWHRLGEAGSFYEKVRVLEVELPLLSSPECPRSEALSRMFLADQPAHFQTVDSLAQHVCYSTRQLNRVAHRLFGLSAEELTLYKKFVESVKLIHAGTGSLTEVAYSAGFYDQAHFSRVFKSYAGLAPRAYTKTKTELPFHIIE